MAKTILVIEDDKSVARMLKDLLEAEGFAVLVERDGEWGLRAFQTKPVDLIILDVLIPKIRGFDLIEKIRAHEKGKTLPIIVISGVYRANMHRERIKGKFDVIDYLDKPVDLDRLLDVLHDVFSSAYPAPEEKQRSSSPEAGAPPALISPAPFTPAPLTPAPPVQGPIPPPPPAHVAPSLPIAPRGDLEEVPFARLFGGLFSVRATGALLLRKSSVKKIVYLREGIPVFVKSNLLHECLGRIMVAERLITQAECDRSLEMKKELGKKQGDLLVEMGSISPHNLEFALELQMQAKLLDIFSWMEGKYQLIPKDDYHGPQVALAQSPAAIIYEGASKTMSAERVNRELRRIAHWRVAPPQDPSVRYQALELERRAGPLLDRIDGHLTVEELLDDAGFNRDDAARLLYALSCTALLPVLEPEERLSRIQLTARPVTGSDQNPIVLGDEDVEVLSTAEINVIAELARIEPAYGRPGVSAEPEVPAEPEPPAEPAPSALPIPHAVPPAAAASVTPPRPPAKELLGDAPVLSSEIRMQVRARLEAEAARLASDRATFRPTPIASSAPKRIPARPPGTTPRVQAARVDGEREEARVRQELGEVIARMKGRNYYEVLDVDRGASLEDIQEAHQSRARAHHPIAVLGTATCSRDLQVLAESVSILIVRAFRTLADPDARRAYDRHLDDDHDSDRIAPLLSADRAFQRGKEALDRGEWESARAAFEQATTLNPDEGVYWAHLAWALFSASPNEAEAHDRAIAYLERAQELSPRCEDPYVFRGLIHQASGRPADALRDCERALRCNPDCVSALRLARALEPPALRKAGLFSRLTIGGGHS